MTFRRIVVTLFSALVLVGAVGCTSISPASSPFPSASGAPTVVASNLPSTLPSSPVLSSEPSIDQPTIAPTDAPAATTTTTAAPAPNLVVKKFEIDASPVLAETPFHAIFNIRNTGNADAKEFSATVKELNTDDGVKGSTDPITVSGGLAAGEQTTVTLPLTLPKEGTWKLTAVADSGGDVKESNEDDNTRDVTVNVTSGELPDLAWQTDGFTMTLSQALPGKYEIVLKFSNSGTATADEVIFVGLRWTREGGASGDLYDATYADPIEPGGMVELDKADAMPGPGNYTVTATLDKTGNLHESNENNNEISIQLTVE